MSAEPKCSAVLHRTLFNELMKIGFENMSKASAHKLNSCIWLRGAGYDGFYCLQILIARRAVFHLFSDEVFE